MYRLGWVSNVLKRPPLAGNLVEKSALWGICLPSDLPYGQPCVDSSSSCLDFKLVFFFSVR